MTQQSTIFALATAPGKAGVAVVRLSGPQVLATLAALTGRTDWQPRMAVYAAIRHPHTQAIIDRGLALYFPAPHSFTGEEVAELHLHGSLAVIRELLDVLAGQPGLRLAERGEFTRRAFINSKMDLVEAEGLADLIEAETSAQKTQALRQMQGQMSRFYDDLRGRALQSLALIEAYIDFPDEEIPESVLADFRDSLQGLSDAIGAQLADSGRAQRVREGLSVVILGEPNAGKSSLLNALAGREAAIVSQQAGTTRDIIEVHMDIAGYPTVLMDTAGLRESVDSIEEEGVKRALARAREADITLILFDGTQGLPDSVAALAGEHSILVATKADLGGVVPAGALSLSTHTGEGVEALVAALEARVVSFFSGAEQSFITRARHRGLLQEAQQHLQRARAEHLPLELVAEELRRGALLVGKITGKIAVDDVLGAIFSQFCIGK
jgi:tRNA modification GTPase